MNLDKDPKPSEPEKLPETRSAHIPMLGRGAIQLISGARDFFKTKFGSRNKQSNLSGLANVHSEPSEDPRGKGTVTAWANLSPAGGRDDGQYDDWLESSTEATRAQDNSGALGSYQNWHY